MSARSPQLCHFAAAMSPRKNTVTMQNYCKGKDNVGTVSANMSLDRAHHICQFCSTDKIFGLIFAPHKKWVKCDKMDVASKQRKSQQHSIYCKFVMWSIDKLLHIINVEQFVIDSHDKIAPHDK